MPMDDLGGRGDEDGEPPLLERVRPVVLGWLALAVIACATVFAVTPFPEPDITTLLWALALTVLLIVTGLIDFPVFVGRVSESTGLGELGLIPVMLLLDPGLAIIVAVVGIVVVEAVLTRGYDDRLAKLTFNVSFQVLTVAIGSWLHFAVVGSGLPITVLSLTVAALVVAIDLVVNVLALGSLQAVATRRSYVRTVRELTASLAFLNLATGFTGILLAVIAVAAPLALPLLLVPILVYRGRTRDRSAGVEQLRIERDRFERTVAGATDGVVLIDEDGRIEVWNPAMEALSGRSRDEVLGQRLADVGWGALLEARHGPSGARRVTIGDTSVEVHRSELSDGRGTVLSVEDVSREVELARIREDLVSRISHELRTPLTTVEGFLETLDARWDQLGEHERRRLAAIARQGGHRLSQLVDKLLVWSDIEARDPHAGMSPSGSTVGNPLAVLRQRLAEGPEDLHLDVVEDGDDLLVAMSDHDLDLVFEQLLTNARQYGRPPIVLGFERDHDVVHLSVTDHGPGLPSEFVPDAFLPFLQGDEGLQRTARGLGLGLAIVHSLVVHTGGSVVVEQPRDAGARFVVSLPRAAPDEVARDARRPSA